MASDTEINLVFADMMRGGCSGGSSGGSSGGKYDAEVAADLLTTKWFDLMVKAVEDTNRGSISSTWGPKLKALCTSNVVVYFEKDGVAVTYDYNHLGDFPADIAATVNIQLRSYTNKVFELSNNGKSMTVDGLYFGYERTLAGEWRAFTGTQSFDLVLVDGEWKISRVERIRRASFAMTTV